MNTLVKVTLSIALLLSIVIPFAFFASGEKSKGRYKKALAQCRCIFRRDDLFRRADV